jgi:hypothetical protein
MLEELELIENVKILAHKSNLLNEAARKNYEKKRKNEVKVYFDLPNKLMNSNDTGIKINLLAMDADFTLKLINYAKLNNVKITGLLITSLFYALKDLFEENKILMPKDVSIFIPVNLRFRVQPNIDFSQTRLCVLGCSMDLLHPNFGKYEYNTIEEVNYVDRVLAEKIRDGAIFDFFFDEKYNQIEKLYDEVDLKGVYNILDSQRRVNILLSNTGTYVSDQKNVLDGPLKIEELYYGDSIKSYPSPHNLIILHAHTFNNRLMIQLSTNRTRINSIHADRFMILFENNLRKLIKS